VGQGDFLVPDARGHPAHPNLGDDEGRAVQRGRPVRRPRDAGGEVGMADHPLHQPADDLQPLRADVVEGDFLYLDLVPVDDEAVHKLRRVGTSPADDGDFPDDGHFCLQGCGRVTTKTRRHEGKLTIKKLTIKRFFVSLCLGGFLFMPGGCRCG
jgi:hypothetical protein